MEEVSKKGAKEVALKILSSRWRSEKEIEKRLKDKGFEEGTIEETISWLKEFGYTDDEKFGHQWAKYRIENRSYGLIRISYELNEKGVDRQIITTIVDRLRDEFDERKIAMAAAEKKVKGMQKSQSALRKLYGYLMRKGFPPTIVIDVMEDIEWE
ncbi:MAG: regulatory protein RecX [Nitrospinota bacterium]|nr:recombination regulator RecX [Nitrospinota bacterium]